MLAVDVGKKLGDFALEIQFASQGTTALFGPSGSGKSSIVNLVAGLIAPDRGKIVIDDETLFDKERGIDVPAHKRRIGYVFQEGRLFPHMSVARNLDYGRRMNAHPVDEAARSHVLDMLDLGGVMDRRPGNLSGGERQRVAIGRALLAKPRLLLMDEPLASLDAARKSEIFPYLERLRAEAVPMIYVSHQADEVRRIADHVVRVERGRVVETGGAEIL